MSNWKIPNWTHLNLVSQNCVTEAEDNFQLLLKCNKNPSILIIGMGGGGGGGQSQLKSS